VKASHQIMWCTRKTTYLNKIQNRNWRRGVTCSKRGTWKTKKITAECRWNGL